MDELIDFKKSISQEWRAGFNSKKWKAIKESCCYGPSLSLN